jgi:hypothetical protein
MDAIVYAVNRQFQGKWIVHEYTQHPRQLLADDVVAECCIISCNYFAQRAYKPQEK